MPASYTIRRSVPRNTRRSKPASTPSTCFPSFSINLFMAFPLPRGDLSSNTTNIIREQETPSPFGCGYAALWCQGMQDSRGTLVPPRHQVRGVQALTPEQGTDATRLLFGLIGFGQDSLLVLGCEDAAWLWRRPRGWGGRHLPGRRRPRGVRPRSARPHCALRLGPKSMSSCSSC